MTAGGCLPRGVCLPSGGVCLPSGGVCLPGGGVYPWGVSAWGVSAQGVSIRGGCLPGGCLPRGCLPGKNARANGFSVSPKLHVRHIEFLTPEIVIRN